MIYGLSTRAFIEDGPAVQAIHAKESHSTARSWRALDAQQRLVLIEQALSAPANDLFDAYPPAL
jgi:hypothetical protein